MFIYNRVFLFSVLCPGNSPERDGDFFAHYSAARLTISQHSLRYTVGRDAHIPPYNISCFDDHPCLLYFSSDCNEYSQPKASLVKGRGTAIAVEGLRSLRYGVTIPPPFGHLPFTREAFIPPALRATLRAPRRQSLLHALAKNMPQAYFLNASRPFTREA